MTMMDIGDDLSELYGRVYDLEQSISDPDTVGVYPTDLAVTTITFPGGSPVVIQNAPPGPVTGLITTASAFLSNIIIDVTWTAPADGLAIAYDVELAKKNTGGTYQVPRVIRVYSTQARFENLDPSSTYGVRVIAVGRLGAQSTPNPSVGYSDRATIQDTTLPLQVTGLVATSSPTGVTLTWDESTDADVKLGAGLYQVDRATNNTFTTGLTSERTAATIYTETGLTPGTTYWYRVSAIDSSGNQGPPSTSVSSVPGAAGASSDGSAPTSSPTPTITQMIGGLFARWTATTNADPVTYEVHISTASGFTPGAGTKVGEVDGTALFISTDATGTALAYGTSYYIKLISKDKDGSAAAGGQAGPVQVNRITSADITDLTIAAADLANATITLAKMGNNSVGSQALVFKDMDNFAIDGSFENSAVDQERLDIAASNSGAISYVTDQPNAFHGSRFLRFTQTTLPSTFRSISLTNWVPIKPGEKIYLKAATKRSVGADGTTYLAVGWRLNDGTGSAAVAMSNNAATGAWSEASAFWTAPANCKEFRVYVEVNNAATTGTTDWDAVEVRKVIQTAIIDDAAITNAKIQDAAITNAKIQDAAITNAKINDLDAGKINAGTIAAARIAAQSITVDKLTVGALGESAAINGEFEDVSGGVPLGWAWGSLTNATASLSTGAAAVAGNNSPSISNTAAGVWSWALTASSVAYFVPVNPGEVWSLSIIVDSSVAQASGFSLRGYFFQADKSTASATSSLSATPGTSVALAAGKQLLSGQVTIPSDAKWMRLQPQAVSLPSAGTIKLDSMQARKVVISAYIGDGAITTAKIATGSITAASGIIASLDAGTITTGSMSGARITAGTITTDRLTVSAFGSNMIANGSLEENDGTTPTGFGYGPAGGSTSAIVTGATSVSGNVSVQFVVPATVGGNGLYPVPANYIPVNSGEVWELAAFLGASAATTNGLYLRAVWFDAAKVALSSPANTDTLSNVAIATAAQWYRGQVTVPTGARFMRVALIISAPNVATTVTIGEVRSAPTAVTTSIADGVISTAKIVTAGLDAQTIKFGTMSGARITTNTLDVNALTASTLSSKTITIGSGGALSIGSPPTTGLLINDQGLRLYSGGVAKVVLDAPTGAGTFTGTISGSSISGGTITSAALNSTTITGSTISTGGPGTPRLQMNSYASETVNGGIIYGINAADGVNSSLQLIDNFWLSDASGAAIRTSGASLLLNGGSGGSGIQFNDTAYVNGSIYGNWWRSQGQTGWYNETYGRGMYMIAADGFVRVYGSPGHLYVPSNFQVDSVLAHYGGANTFSIRNLSGGATRTITQSSDQATIQFTTSARWKKRDIRPLDVPVSELYQIEPVFYFWNTDLGPEIVYDPEQKIHGGFIADQVEEHFPDAVVYDFYDGKIEDIEDRALLAGAYLMIQDLNERMKVLENA